MTTAPITPEFKYSEQPAIELFQHLGYQYYDASRQDNERTSIKDVILLPRLEAAIKRINPWINENNLKIVIRKLTKADSSDLLIANSKMHHWLSGSNITLTQTIDGREMSRGIHVITYNNIANNDFLVVNQMTFKGLNNNSKPDLVVYINGLPIAVILKSPAVDEAQAGRMVLKKAAWIIEKLKLVAREPQGDIVSGSRLLYLGRKYYTQLIQDPMVSTVRITFNHSAFKIQVPPNQPQKQTLIEQKLAEFYRQKAIEKLTPRISHWIQITGLTPKTITFRKLNKSWGSCTPKHNLIFNIEVVKLPFTLIDYIIVHELCHLKHPGHNRGFRREVAKYLPAYKELEIRINEMKC